MSTTMRPLQALRSSRPKQNSGLTLIELMVGLVIGLVLAIVASSTYLYSKQAFNAVSENSQMEESGRFALNLLARNIQSAGYVALARGGNSPQGPSDLKIRGCDFGMTNPKTATSTADLACLGSTPAGTTRSASIGVFYNTDVNNTAGGKFQGFDCLGNAPVTAASIPAGGSPTYEVRSYFFISTTTAQTPYGTTTMGQLSCVTDPTTVTGATATFQAQPLIPGIHQMAVTYLTPSALDSKVAQTNNTAAAIEAAATWPQVVAVELCVLTKSIQASGNDTATQVTDCYGNSFTPPPSQSFRRFTSIVNLRNRTPA
jgi:type IV pilus assembly protein PilW